MLRPGLVRACYTLLAIVVASALVIQVIVSLRFDVGMTGDPGTDAKVLGTRFLRMASFFTIESNALVLVLAVSLVLRPDRDGPLWRVLHMDSLLGIVITGAVFVAVLSPVLPGAGIVSVATVIFHYVTPPAVVVGWFVFGPRPRIDGKTVLSASVWPIAWIVWTFAHGAVTGWYPYSFVDVGRLGPLIVSRNVGMVLAAAILIGALLWWVDRWLPATGQARSAGVAPLVSR